MSREIRRVPLDWVHPKYLHQYLGHPLEMVFHPLYDEAYEDALATWEEDRRAWSAGEPVPSDWHDPKRRRSDLVAEYPGVPFDELFEEEFGGAPDPAYYRDRKWTTEEATAFQLYETVSEGTPVSPVCATEVDMVAWLTTAMVDERGQPFTPMSRAGAEEFVRQGWVFSAVSSPEHGMEPGLEHIDRVAQEAAGLASVFGGEEDDDGLPL